MILAPLKVSQPGSVHVSHVARVYLKESSVFLVSIMFRIQTRKCTKLFTENVTECFAHAQTVCTRPRLRGGRGLGMRLLSTISLILVPRLHPLHKKKLSGEPKSNVHAVTTSVTPKFFVFKNVLILK